MSDQNVNVKKVKAYPIPMQLKTESDVFPARIVRLTFQGFLAEVATGQVKPGDQFDVVFELPVSRVTVAERGKTVKIYNQWTGRPSGPALPSETEPTPSASASARSVIHLVEVHFVNLSFSGKENIAQFLEALAKVTKSG